MFRLFLVYLDDILVYSSDFFNSHMVKLEKIFQRLQVMGFKLNPEKCRFCVPKVEFLDHTVSARGIGMTENKVGDIRAATTHRLRVKILPKFG